MAALADFFILNCIYGLQKVVDLTVRRIFSFLRQAIKVYLSKHKSSNPTSYLYPTRKLVQNSNCKTSPLDI